MPDRLQAAEMRVAICHALGIDPTGISSLVLTLTKDDLPRIEVTYSQRYIAGLGMARADDQNPVTRNYRYEMVPIQSPELAVPAQGSDWVDDTTVGEHYQVQDPRYPHPNDLPPTPFPPGRGGAATP